MSTAKTIAKNATFLLSTEVLNKVISFLLVIIITRYLGDVGFGKYSFAFAYISMFAIFANLGIGTYIFREISKHKEKSKDLLNNALTIKLAATAPIFILAAAIAFYWPKAFEVFFAIVLVMIHDVLEMYAMLMRTLFNAHEKTHFGLVGVGIERIISLSLGVYMLAAGYGLTGLLWTLILARTATAVYMAFICHRKFHPIGLAFDFPLWKDLLKKSMPFWFTLLFLRIFYKTDTIMLTAMKDYAVTGWYNAGATLVAALAFIPAIIINATFPAMSRFHHQNVTDHLKLLYHKSFYYLVSLGVPITIGIAMLSERLILFIYKEQFAATAIVLQILSLSITLVFANHMMGYLLNSINKQHLFTITNGICAAANIALNYFLISSFSYVGASIATVLTQLINFISLYHFTVKNKFPLNLFKIFAKPIIAGTIMGVSIYYLAWLPIVEIVPIVAIIYFVVLLAIGGLGKEEIQLIKSFLPKKHGK